MPEGQHRKTTRPLRRKIDVYIAVPLDQLDAQTILIRLMINIILGAVIRQDRRWVAAKRILMVLDEFARVGRPGLRRPPENYTRDMRDAVERT